MNDPIIAKYQTYLLLEKSLSKNTIENYERDLSKLLHYLADAKIDYKSVEIEHLRDFLIDIAELGIHARSQARIISGIKSFYKFLHYDGVIAKDPTELLELPKIGRHLPEVLNVEEINAIIDAIDMSKPDGQRNRAIIETLYGSGLRVSELLNLKLSKINFEEEYMQVEGKGNKQRLVPISEIQQKQIKLWLMDRSQLTIKKGNEDFLFLSKFGSQLSRVMIFLIIKQLAELAGIQKTISPHTFLRLRGFAIRALLGKTTIKIHSKILNNSVLSNYKFDSFSYLHLQCNDTALQMPALITAETTFGVSLLQIQQDELFFYSILPHDIIARERCAETMDYNSLSHFHIKPIIVIFRTFNIYDVGDLYCTINAIFLCKQNNVVYLNIAHRFISNR